MKEEFKSLYDYIIHSKDEEKMHVLGRVTKDMMCKVIDNFPQQAREYLDVLESVKWHNYVTSKESERIVEDMTPQPAFTRHIWNNMMSQHGFTLCEEPYYNEHALYVSMCMVSSDSGETISNEIKSFGANAGADVLFKFIYKLALDKLKDKDKKFNIRTYFNL